MGVPPGGGEGVEVGDLGRVDGCVGGWACWRWTLATGALKAVMYCWYGP